MKIVAITQARTGSTRLPNKILKEINNQSLLKIHIDRIKKSKKINEIIIATTTNAQDDIIVNIGRSLEVSVHRGSEQDVLDRFYQAAVSVKADLIVRLTSDCPIIDAEVIDNIIENAIDSNVDYCSNTLIESFPDGQDAEVFTFESLKKAWIEAKLDSEREHVTPYIKKNSTFYNKNLFKALNVTSDKLIYQNVRMTVDESNDFEVMELLINKLGVDKTWVEYAEFYLKDPNINEKNKHIIRNEGYLKSISKEN